jgi:hypothetical protein
MTKTRLNLSLDHGLVDFVKVYAQENRTTVSEMMTQFILTLKRKAEGDSIDLIYSRVVLDDSAHPTAWQTCTVNWH